jgi:tRNA G46 methylase TrmB
MEMLFKFYEGLDREGPGSPEMTERAFHLCEGLPDDPAILELGCGSGGATMALAAMTGGTIVATDVYQPFLDRLMERARQQGVADRIRAVEMDMSHTPLKFRLGTLRLRNGIKKWTIAICST